MQVFRLSNTKYANDLTGEGARLFGGRWNHVGVPCVYTSENRALAVLEYSVNTNIDKILRNLSMVILDIPDDVLDVPVSHLPGDWRDYPAPSSTKDFGSALISKGEHLIIKIPSTVIPQEFNYVINPRHHLITECKVVEVKDFVYDTRIKNI